MVVTLQQLCMHGWMGGDASSTVDIVEGSIAFIGAYSLRS